MSDLLANTLSTVRSSGNVNPIHRLTLLVIHETHTSAVALPVTGTVHVGRSTECEIRVDHPSLSRKHLRFDFTADRFTVTDLDSSNGTQLGAHRIPANTPVEFSANDPLVAGEVTLVVQTFRKKGPSSPACYTAPAPLPSTSSATFNDTAPAPTPIVVDPVMCRIYDLAARLARGQLCILINGETGVGKEVLADFIHAASRRAKQPFIRVNCAALSDDLVESELFGHERGAFTGAQRERIGLLESAHGGTVLLDEIGEVSLAVQAKLLRVIEQQQLFRVGASSPRSIDVRFIAATNRDIEEDVAQGRFRSDLFFRIAGAVLLIPPLRERRQEIDVLARAFAAQAARKLQRTTPQ